MTRKWVPLVVLATVALAGAPALAQHGHGHGGGITTMRSGLSSNPPGFSHGKKHGWDSASAPPGWSRGEKKGWNGGRMPPGLIGRTSG